MSLPTYLPAYLPTCLPTCLPACLPSTYLPANPIAGPMAPTTTPRCDGATHSFKIVACSLLEVKYFSRLIFARRSVTRE